MAPRYTYTTCLMFGSDGEADHVEIDVTVSYEVDWLEGEVGRGEIEDIRVESIDGTPADRCDAETVAASLDRMEYAHRDLLLTHAYEEAAADYQDGLERRAEAQQERAWSEGQ